MRTPDSVDRNADSAVMRQRKVLCANPYGLHHMAYMEWGARDNPNVLICVHGLTRNGHDFDDLARRMSSDYRVVCPDVVGRGVSDWLPVKTSYGFPLYVNDMITLLARLDVEQVHWVGTSMGGLIGMIIAALPGSPISRLVLNDVGPVISVDAIARIAEFVGNAPLFPDIDTAEAYIRVVSAPFGPLTDAQWKHLAKHAVKPAEGGFVMRYDPGIAEAFRKNSPADDIDQWPLYDAIVCPTMVMRGAQSDLLTRETAAEMAARGPRAHLVEVPGVGHAPMLLDAGQIDVVRSFLLDKDK